MMLISALPMKPAPNTVRTHRHSHATPKYSARPKKRRQKPVLEDESFPNSDCIMQPSTNLTRPAQKRQRTISAAEGRLMDVLLNRKSRGQKTKASHSKPKDSFIKCLWKRFTPWVMGGLFASSSQSKPTSSQSSPKLDPDLSTTSERHGTNVVYTYFPALYQYSSILGPLRDTKVNTRVAAVDIPTCHSHRQASLLLLPTVGPAKHQNLTHDRILISAPHIHRPPRGSKIMSPENEAKIDKVMERVTGINCRRGLGVQSEDLGSGLSYGYGFYWTCCNEICAKARVMGNLGGVMEVTVQGPCKRKNSLAEERCRECGHLICAICEKIAECAEANKENRCRVSGSCVRAEIKCKSKETG